MNLSARLFLNHPIGFFEPLGRTGYLSTGLTCHRHHKLFPCLRNLVYSVNVRVIHALSTGGEPFNLARSLWAKGG